MIHFANLVRVDSTRQVPAHKRAQTQTPIYPHHRHRPRSPSRKAINTIRNYSTGLCRGGITGIEVGRGPGMLLLSQQNAILLQDLERCAKRPMPTTATNSQRSHTKAQINIYGKPAHKRRVGVLTRNRERERARNSESDW
jgi:hypothetical protein